MTALRDNRTARLTGGYPLRPAGLPLGELGVWGLCLAMLLGAVALLGPAGVWAAGPLLHASPWVVWLLAPAFAAAERFAVHVHFRRSAHSMSLAEIPLVVGLLFAGGRDVVIAAALGRLFVLAAHRRLPPLRLVFNLGQFLLGASLAVLVCHLLSGGAVAGGGGVWLAVAVGVGASSVFVALAISAAVALSEGGLGLVQVAGSLRDELAIALANTAIALGAVRLVNDDWRAGILLTVPVLGMFLAMRGYSNERRRHGRLEFLYETSRALAGSPDVGAALEGVLAQALDAFRVDAAEIVFLSPDGNEALRTTLRAQGRGESMHPLRSDATAVVRGLLAHQPPGARVSGTLPDPALADYLARRGLAGGLFALLEGERGPFGALIIGDPSGVVDRFGDDDLRLFEALAHNTSAVLENERLGQTVWRMRKLQGELEHQASHDPLTDLANRVLFTERLAQALRAGSRPAVLFLDVNEFKAVNDSLGHAAGDELLLAIAARLRECVRAGDTLARFGGDEFAVLVPDAGAGGELAHALAGRIGERLQERFSVAGRSLAMRMSIGIASAAGSDVGGVGGAGGVGGVGAEELIRNADLAMYRAKQGQTGCERFEPGMELPVLRRHGLKQRLRDAAGSDGSFEVHYQPIVELATGTLTAQEALVRWLDGPRGCVPPASFIPIAEEMGVIVDIGRRVLLQACRDACSWPTERAVHVNLSPIELRDPRFVAGVEEALSLSGLAASRLVLEITEGVVLRDPAGSVATLAELRALGVQLALDDFGTGYSSLSHLRELPLDWLKIGTPFVDDVAGDGANRPFMRMIVDLAASLGLGVVAEGIETALQMDALRELGCGFGQGFHLGRPALPDPGAGGAASISRLRAGVAVPVPVSVVD